MSRLQEAALADEEGMALAREIASVAGAPAQHGDCARAASQSA